jgi:plastocyanin
MTEHEYPPSRGLLVGLMLIALILAVAMTYLMVFPIKAAAVPGTPVVIPNGTASDTSLNFNPPSLPIKVHTAVQWKNNDASPHTSTASTAPNGGTKWDSGELDPGDSFTVTFDIVGNYTYRCAFHSAWMRGTITVTP